MVGKVSNETGSPRQDFAVPSFIAVAAARLLSTGFVIIVPGGGGLSLADDGPEGTSTHAKGNGVRVARACALHLRRQRMAQIVTWKLSMRGRRSELCGAHGIHRRRGIMLLFREIT